MMKETFFITHGSPRLTVDETHPLHIFFKSWKDKVFTKKPKAILVISAHWLSDQPSVNAVDVNETMYDYEGITYPAPLYQLKYPTPGSPDLAKRIQELLIGAGFETVHIDKERGLDHATWVPLMVMYPEANIPVCELSVQQHLDAKHHFNLGRALAPLKDEDVLIIGTGSTTHPSWDTPHYRDGVAPWAAEFVSWLEGAIVDGSYEELKEFETKAPNLKQAHPMPEHLFPLHVVIGAAGENCKAEIVHSSWYYGLLSNGTLRHGAYKFTSC